MFKEERDGYHFEWGMIGDIGLGRPNLGPGMDVRVYRLMQFTLRDVLIKEFDVETSDKIYHQAGEQAGRVFLREIVGPGLDLGQFIKRTQELLAELKIGILRVEKSDPDNLNFTVTVAEDLDCSGLPVCDETICTYDEGFLSGLFEEYTGMPFDVKEVDCWCSGDRVCRFEVKPAADGK